MNVAACKTALSLCRFSVCCMCVDLVVSYMNVMTVFFIWLLLKQCPSVFISNSRGKHSVFLSLAEKQTNFETFRVHVAACIALEKSTYIITCGFIALYYLGQWGVIQAVLKKKITERQTIMWERFFLTEIVWPVVGYLEL